MRTGRDDGDFMLEDDAAMMMHAKAEPTLSSETTGGDHGGDHGGRTAANDLGDADLGDAVTAANVIAVTNDVWTEENYQNHIAQLEDRIKLLEDVIRLGGGPTDSGGGSGGGVGGSSDGPTALHDVLLSGGGGGGGGGGDGDGGGGGFFGSGGGALLGGGDDGDCGGSIDPYRSFITLSESAISLKKEVVDTKMLDAHPRDLAKMQNASRPVLWGVVAGAAEAAGGRGAKVRRGGEASPYDSLPLGSHAAMTPGCVRVTLVSSNDGYGGYGHRGSTDHPFGGGSGGGVGRKATAVAQSFRAEGGDAFAGRLWVACDDGVAVAPAAAADAAAANITTAAVRPWPMGVNARRFFRRGYPVAVVAGVAGDEEEEDKEEKGQVPVFLLGSRVSEVKSLSVPRGDVAFILPTSNAVRGDNDSAGADAGDAADGGSEDEDEMFHMQVGGFGCAFHTVLSVADAREFAELTRFENLVAERELVLRRAGDFAAAAAHAETMDRVVHALGWLASTRKAGYLLDNDKKLHLKAARTAMELLSLFPFSRYPAVADRILRDVSDVLEPKLTAVAMESEGSAAAPAAVANPSDGHPGNAAALHHHHHPATTNIVQDPHHAIAHAHAPLSHHHYNSTPTSLSAGGAGSGAGAEAFGSRPSQHDERPEDAVDHHSRWSSWGGFANAQYEAAYFHHTMAVVESNVETVRIMSFLMQAVFTYKRVYLEYRAEVEPAEMSWAVGWMAASMLVLLLVQRKFPHVKDGVLGFTYPYDCIFWSACLMALWPNLALYVATDSPEKALTVPLGFVVIQLVYMPSMKTAVNYFILNTVMMALKLFFSWSHVHPDAKANVWTYGACYTTTQIGLLVGAYYMDRASRGCFRELLSDTKKRNQLVFAASDKSKSLKQKNT